MPESYLPLPCPTIQLHFSHGSPANHTPRTRSAQTHHFFTSFSHGFRKLSPDSHRFPRFSHGNFHYSPKSHEQRGKIASLSHRRGHPGIDKDFFNRIKDRIRQHGYGFIDAQVFVLDDDFISPNLANSKSRAHRHIFLKRASGPGPPYIH